MPDQITCPVAPQLTTHKHTHTHTTTGRVLEHAGSFFICPLRPLRRNVTPTTSIKVICCQCGEPASNRTTSTRTNGRKTQPETSVWVKGNDTASKLPKDEMKYSTETVFYRRAKKKSVPRSSLVSQVHYYLAVCISHAVKQLGRLEPLVKALP